MTSLLRLSSLVGLSMALRMTQSLGKGCSLQIDGSDSHGSSDRTLCRYFVCSLSLLHKINFTFYVSMFQGFLGKSAREICIQLGFGEDWLKDKIPKGKLFKLAIFPSVSVDSSPATWDGVAYLLERHFPEVWPKVSRHLPEIRNMSISEIEAKAGYNMSQANLVGRRGGAFDTEGESDDPNYMSLQRLKQREGTLVEVRQFLWDEIGIKVFIY